MVAVFAQLRPGRKLKSRVEIFYEGTHIDSEGNKLTYTAEDIDDIARNFAVLSDGDRPVLEPPIGIDHDTAKYMPDSLLSNTRLSQGEPVAVFAETVKIDGKPVRMLFADLAVTPEAGLLIDRGYLNGVSSEVMDEDQLPADAKAAGAKGKALRRIALLGYDLPALKRLKGLGKLPTEAGVLAPVKFSEHKPKNRIKRLLDSEKKPCGVAFFCDAHRSFQGDTMPREELLAWLQSKGVDTGAITEAVPDALLEMMKKIIEENEALKAGGAPPEGGMSDGKRDPKQVTLRYSELEARAKRIESAFAKIDADAQNRAALDKAKDIANIHSFAESMVKERRLSSADLECDKDGNPLPTTELATLHRAADVTTLHTFSEGGRTVKKTALEMEMARIKAKPQRNYSERIQAQKGGQEQGSKSGVDLARERANKYADKVLAHMGRK